MGRDRRKPAHHCVEYIGTLGYFGWLGYQMQSTV